MYIFVPDFTDFLRPLLPLMNKRGETVVDLHWLYGFDMDCTDEIQIAIQDRLMEQLEELSLSGEAGYAQGFSVRSEGVAKERTAFYGLFGGLFFLGILLGIVFIFAAVLIVYYKQISEGYEDQSRFEIMQKVGMTPKEIKRSINSQVLTVFFLPLIAARNPSGLCISSDLPDACPVRDGEPEAAAVSRPGAAFLFLHCFMWSFTGSPPGRIIPSSAERGNGKKKTELRWLGSMAAEPAQVERRVSRNQCCGGYRMTSAVAGVA